MAERKARVGTKTRRGSTPKIRAGARKKLDTALSQLEAVELVRPAQESERSFLFKHAVIQDTTYQSLLKQERRRLHLAIGVTLERLYDARADEFAAELTHHFSEAGDETKTLEYAQLAGDSAARIFAYPEANAHYARALDALVRLPAAPESIRLRVDLIVKLVAVSLRIEGPEQSLERLQIAEELLSTLDKSPADRERLARVHFWMGDAYSHQNQQRKAIAYLQQALQGAQEQGTDETLLAIPSNVIGRALVAQGLFQQAEPLLAQAAPLLERSANWYEWILSVGFLGMARGAQGEIEAGLKETEYAFRRAQDLGTPIGIGDSHIFSSFIYMQRGSLHEVVSHAEAALAAAGKLGDQLLTYMAWNVRGWAAGRLSRFDEAESNMRQGQELAARMGGQVFFADLFLSAYAELAWLQGQGQLARERAEYAIQVAQTVGSVYSEGLARRVLAQALAGPTGENADEHFRASLQLFESGNARLEAARTRMVWGKILRARGDVAPAREHFEQAAAQFKSSGLTLELQDTGSWLQELE